MLNYNMENIKLVNNLNKYLTNFDDKNIEVKSKQTGLKQNFSYNVQGELVTNNKCVTSDSNNSVYLDDCNNNNSQKWFYDNGKISSEENSDKCLEAIANEVTLQDCDNSEYQQWNKENTNDTEDNFTWQKYKGKNVILVESDNPWYLYNNDKYELKYVSAELDNNLKYRDNSDYASIQVLDSNKPNLGLGYSYKDRQSINCNRIEPFEQVSTKSTNSKQSTESNNNILIMSIVLLLVFLIYALQK